MQVYKKILVTIDCSEVDTAIIEHVALLALQNKAEVSLLHVVHSHTLDQDSILRQKAEVVLKNREKFLREKGVHTEIIICSGEPEEEIIRIVSAGDYDLVAMATHGHGFICDALFGSVSRAVKHNISVPLLLLGPGVECK